MTGEERLNPFGRLLVTQLMGNSKLFMITSKSITDYRVSIISSNNKSKTKGKLILSRMPHPNIVLKAVVATNC